jgi:cellulose synthase operon protein C
VDAFRAVMHDRGRSVWDCRQAASGLATLGPRHRTEAATVLTGYATDPTRRVAECVVTAEALAELGPQYRTTAARCLRDLLALPGLDASDRHQAAAAIAELGHAEFLDEAAAQLRAVIADGDAGCHTKYRAITDVVDLRPEYHAEAVRQLRQLADDPLADGFERAQILGWLARRDPSQESIAVARLRAYLADSDASAEERVWFAGELKDLGPEYHPEVIAGLQAVIAVHSDPNGLGQAWSMLAALAPAFRQHAEQALLNLLRSPAVSGFILGNVTYWLLDLGGVDRQQIADALSAVLVDDRRSGHSRIQAAVALLRLGRPYHSSAARGFCQLLGVSEILLDINIDVGQFLAVGGGPRAELVKTLRAILSESDAPPNLVSQTAQVLLQLGCDEQVKLHAALRAVAADEYADLVDRYNAVETLAQSGPGSAAEAVELLRSIITSTNWRADWRQVAVTLTRLGGDVASLLLVLLADQDVARRVRETAAAVLAELNPNMVGPALAELRSQAQDLYLQMASKSDVIVAVVKLDPDTRSHAIAVHHDLVNDETKPAFRRCWAAYELVQLDRTYWPQTVATLRQLAVSPIVAPADRKQAIHHLYYLNALRPSEAGVLPLAVIQHPATPPSVRRGLVRYLPPPLRHDTELTLLGDHTAPVDARLPDTSPAGECPLPDETEAALRDVLAAAESRPAERVKAAAALARLSPRFVREAIGTLQVLAQAEPQAAVRARAELAKLSGHWRRRLINDAERIIADESRPRREQRQAFNLLDAIAPVYTTAMLTYLRTQADDPRLSDQHRVDALFALRPVNGLDPLRALRDDHRTAPATRWRAAMKLIYHTADDRATAAHILHGIATTPTIRAALRWRAARDLADLGRPGQDMAVEALRAITADGTLPVTARANAARELVKARPTCIDEATDSLHALTTTPNPLHRIQVYLAMGALDTTTATPALRTMAEDRTLTPVTRMRAAEAVAQLRRDYHEPAAIVARELMHDHAVPRHVRATAARNLARWSALCRQEARSAATTDLGHPEQPAGIPSNRPSAGLIGTTRRPGTPPA